MNQRDKLLSTARDFLIEKQSEYAEKWIDLEGYLKTEFADGKREFRIAFQDDNHILIHPLNKDGKTVDIFLNPEIKA